MADPTVAPRPRISTAQADTLPDPRTSDDLPTPRAEWNPHLQPQRTDMDYLSPNAQRSSSDKGKGRSLDVEEDPFGYEAYQEPEYLTVRPQAQRNRSGESERPFIASDEEPRRGTYQPHQGDLEMGMDSVGNREGLGVVELENGAAYPPVSEEDAEERRIKDVSTAYNRGIVCSSLCSTSHTSPPSTWPAVKPHARANSFSRHTLPHPPAHPSHPPSPRASPAPRRSFGIGHAGATARPRVTDRPRLSPGRKRASGQRVGLGSGGFQVWIVRLPRSGRSGGGRGGRSRGRTMKLM